MKKNGLLPEEIRIINLSAAKEAHLRQYFRETFWKKERDKRLMEINELKEI